MRQAWVGGEGESRLRRRARHRDARGNIPRLRIQHKQVVFVLRERQALGTGAYGQGCNPATQIDVIYGNAVGAEVAYIQSRVVAGDQPARRVLAGLVSQTRRVPRHGYSVLWDEKPCGIVTSGALDELRSGGESLEDAFVRVVGAWQTVGRLEWL